ncbi:MAG: hypothetical protein ACFFD1_11895 [Candidatus Thorarchaeota archaeon]
MTSTREVILKHLRKNRGREIPISELVETYNFSYSRISNAIKDLEYKEEIEIERRPLKKGKYTILRLKGDNISPEGRYIHVREADNSIELMNTEKLIEEKTKKLSSKITPDIKMFINYLKSKDFSMESFNEMVEGLDLSTKLDKVLILFQPLLYRVGELWTDGSLSTAEEHIISARLEKYLMQKTSIKKKSRKSLIILSPVEGEWHTLGLLSLEYIISDKNVQIINLARPLPNISLIDYIRNMIPKPDWIIISITLESFLGTLKHELKILREIFSDSIKIVIGGQGIPTSERNSFPEANLVITNADELKEFLLAI